MTYSYVFGTNGHPSSLFQRVGISRQQSVHSSSFMMEYANIVKRNRRGVLIDTSSNGNNTSATIAMLRKFATVIDVSDSDARRKLLKAAGTFRRRRSSRHT